MKINFTKMSAILTIVLAVFMISTSSAHAEAGSTNWGKITQVKIGAWNTYIYFDGCNCGNAVRLSPSLNDYNQILSAVLTAMSLNLEVQFYSVDLNENKCFVTRIHIRK